MNGTPYLLRAVNNGWVLTVPPDTFDNSLEYGDFVFSTLVQVVVWLASRHNEPMPLELS